MSRWIRMKSVHGEGRERQSVQTALRIPYPVVMRALFPVGTGYCIMSIIAVSAFIPLKQRAH